MDVRNHQFDRIGVRVEKCFGRPCVRRVRMTVASILAYRSGGMGLEEILKQCPETEREDVYQAAGFRRDSDAREFRSRRTVVTKALQLSSRREY